MKCPTCQAENPDTAKFCNNCGARLEIAGDAQETPAPVGKPKKGSRWLLIVGAIVAVVVIGALFAALLSSPGEEATPTPTRVAQATQPADATEAQQPTQAPAPSDTPMPTDTPVPTDTPAPTDTPQPTKTPRPTNTPAPTNTPPPSPTPTSFAPLVFVEFEGSTETVTDNFDAPPCQKAVFVWSVEPSQYDNAGLIIDLYRKGADSGRGLVNAFEAGATGPMTGESLQPLLGGSYYLSVESITGPWKMKGVCLDGQPPAGSEVDIENVGIRVTENYALPECAKSVFVWSVEPSQYGNVGLIIYLHREGADSGVGLVNAFETDVSEALTGDALQPLKGGVYFLEISSTTGPWTLKWECRDL